MKVPRKRAKSTGQSTVTKIPQPHGGALNSGGTLGNAGGPGRTPSMVRAICREAFAVRIPILCLIADDTEAPYEQRRLAIDSLGKHGLTGSISLDDIRERLKATATEIVNALPHAQATMLIEQIKKHWMAT